MSIFSSTIEDILRQAIGKSIWSDPPKLIQEVIQTARLAYAKDGECDAAGVNFYSVVDPLFKVVDYLTENGLFAVAEQLLLIWWEDIGERQLIEKQHISRANNAYKLTEFYLRQGDKGSALRWAMLTHADDVLHQHYEGAGRKWLYSTFGMTEAELQAFQELVKDDAAIDSNTPLFAESMIVKMAKKRSIFERFFALLPVQSEFPISRAYLQALMTQVNFKHNNMSSKGKALEQLAAYLFLLIPGWATRINLLDEQEGFENDLLITNLSNTSNLSTYMFGRHILVECKNWESPVGVRDVGYFLYRMRLTHCQFGIIMAASDVTGLKKAEEGAARSLIRRAFHEDKSTCIVISGSDIDNLRSGNGSFLSLLIQKLEQFRFGKPR